MLDYNRQLQIVSPKGNCCFSDLITASVDADAITLCKYLTVISIIIQLGLAFFHLQTNH